MPFLIELRFLVVTYVHVTAILTHHFNIRIAVHKDVRLPTFQFSLPNALFLLSTVHFSLFTSY